MRYHIEVQLCVAKAGAINDGGRTPIMGPQSGQDEQASASMQPHIHTWEQLPFWLTFSDSQLERMYCNWHAGQAHAVQPLLSLG